MQVMQELHNQNVRINCNWWIQGADLENELQKSFHRFQNYSLSDPPCCTVSHIAEFRFRFINCLCVLTRLTHQLFLIKALQSRLHLDAERTDFSAKTFAFFWSINPRSCLFRKGLVLQRPLKPAHSFLSYHICLSDGGSHTTTQAGIILCLSSLLRNSLFYARDYSLPHPLNCSMI